MCPPKTLEKDNRLRKMDPGGFPNFVELLASRQLQSLRSISFEEVKR